MFYDCLLLLFSYAASISSEPTGLRRGCPSLGSAGLALGGATCRDSYLGEESGYHRRPGASLVASTRSRSGAEGASPRGGGTSSYQGGGRARTAIHVSFGD